MGGGIRRFNGGGGIFGPVIDWITTPIRAIGNSIKDLIERIIIGPKGEVRIVEVPVEKLPEGWRKPTKEEAQRVITSFKDITEPVYDKATGTYVPPMQARRVISEYEYAPNDTTIYYSPYANGLPAEPSKSVNNNDVDLERRIFDALNSLFENEEPKPSTARTPVKRKQPQSSKKDTLTVKVVGYPEANSGL